MSDVVADNDIVIKLSIFRCLKDLVAALGIGNSRIGVLGSLRYVAAPKLNALDDDEVYECFVRFIDQVSELEPDSIEVQLAAEIEEAAQRLNVELDSGESLLMAIAIRRGSDKLVTGDKRAVEAAAAVKNHVGAMSLLDGLVMSLEQLAALLISAIGYDLVRSRICAHSNVDTAMTICFQCGRDAGSRTETQDALRSYHLDLCNKSGGLCAPDL